MPACVPTEASTRSKSGWFTFPNVRFVRKIRKLIMPKHDSPVTARIAEIGGWRGATLTNVHKLIKEAAPHVSEDIKWRKPTNPGGVPGWEQNGLICTGEVYKDKVKITFAHGAALADPKGLFNASLDAGTRRAIDLAEGDKLSEAAFSSPLSRPPSRITGRRR